jgi:hypothetical protein
MVQFFDRGELVKTHPRKQRGKQTDLADYPPEKVAHFMRTPAWCRRQAALIGPACAQVIDELMAENALYRLRAAQGVIGLGGKHDTARLEAACARAIAAGDPSYKTIRGILAAGTETHPLPAPAAGSGAGAFLRGPAQIFGNVLPFPATAASAAADPAATAPCGVVRDSAPVARPEDASAAGVTLVPGVVGQRVRVVSGPPGLAARPRRPGRSGPPCPCGRESRRSRAGFPGRDDLGVRARGPWPLQDREGAAGEP